MGQFVPSLLFLVAQKIRSVGFDQYVLKKMGCGPLSLPRPYIIYNIHAVNMSNCYKMVMSHIRSQLDKDWTHPTEQAGLPNGWHHNITPKYNEWGVLKLEPHNAKFDMPTNVAAHATLVAWPINLFKNPLFHLTKGITEMHRTQRWHGNWDGTLTQGIMTNLKDSLGGWFFYRGRSISNLYSFLLLSVRNMIA